MASGCHFLEASQPETPGKPEKISKIPRNLIGAALLESEQPQLSSRKSNLVNVATPLFSTKRNLVNGAITQATKGRDFGSKGIFPEALTADERGAWQILLPESQ